MKTDTSLHALEERVVALESEVQKLPKGFISWNTAISITVGIAFLELLAYPFISWLIGLLWK